MRYAHPGTPGALVSFKSAYGNYIDGQFVEPLGGEYFMNTSPVDGSDIAQFPAPMPKISILLLMPHTAPRKPGGKHRYSIVPTCCFRSPIGFRRTWNIWRLLKAGTMVNRCAKR